MMENGIEQLCGPVVKVETLHLARHVDVTGRFHLQLMKFSQEVLWVREVTAEMIFKHGGRQLDTGESLHDAGPFMSCVSEAIDDAVRASTEYLVDIYSTLVIEVIATVTDRPLLRRPDTPTIQLFQRRNYDPLPKDWLYGSDEALIEEWRAYYSGGSTTEPTQADPHVDPLQMAQVCVWSSKLPDAVNALIAQEFRKTWNVPCLFSSKGT